MKRDDDYLRDLLIGFEAQEGWEIFIHKSSSGGVDENKELAYVLLLCDEGFMEQMNTVIYRITNDGHDYLAAIRDEGVWQKTKEGAAKIGGASLAMMKDIAIAYVKKEAAEKLGIPL